jgi:arylformamidase
MRMTLASPLILVALLALAASDFALPARGVAAAQATMAKQTLAYGSDRHQTLDYWAGRGAKAPLIVFVHGGAWKFGDKRMMEGSAKLGHWQAQGYAVASVDYRLVPQASVEDEAADVASAVAYLKGHAAALGFDPSRIVLIGHSAGAHLVALVGTDPAWFAAAGLKLTDVKGIVPLDGAAYDVPRQLEIGAPLLHGSYVQAFGTDPARQKKLSPTFQAAAPNAPQFLILHVQREDGIEQSKALAEALRKAGTPVTIQGFPGTGLRGHAAINRQLGEPDYAATPVVDAWLKKVFG